MVTLDSRPDAYLVATDWWRLLQGTEAADRLWITASALARNPETGEPGSIPRIRDLSIDLLRFVALSREEHLGDVSGSCECDGDGWLHVGRCLGLPSDAEVDRWATVRWAEGILDQCHGAALRAREAWWKGEDS